MKMSQYIMEQEISGASIDDIELARCYAEMCVCEALADTNTKCEAICEYATTPTEFDIIQESGFGEKVKGAAGKVKGAVGKVGDGAKAGGSAVKRWWTTFMTWLKKLIESIKRVFMKLNISKTIKILEKLEAANPGGTAPTYKNLYEGAAELFDVVTDFYQLMQANKGADFDEDADFTQDVIDFTNRVKAIKPVITKKHTKDLTIEDRVDVPYTELIALLKRIHGGLKKKVVLNTVFDTPKDDELPFSDATIKAAKECAAAINNKFAEMPLAKMVSLQKQIMIEVERRSGTAQDIDAVKQESWLGDLSDDDEVVQEWGLAGDVVFTLLIGGWIGIVMALYKTSKAPSDVKSALKGIAELVDDSSDDKALDSSDLKQLSKLLKKLAQALSYRGLSRELRKNRDLADTLLDATKCLQKCLYKSEEKLKSAIEEFKDASKKLLEDWE